MIHRKHASSACLRCLCRFIPQLTAVTMTAATCVARSCERSVWSPLIAERTSGEV